MEKKLTFQKAYEIATTIEISMQNMAVLQESKESEAVNQVYKRTDDAYRANLLVFGVEGIIVHKLAGLRN